MKSLPLLVFCLSMGAVRAADWPQWRGPDRTGVSKETGLLKEWPKEGPKLAWTFEDAGVGFSGFAVAGKRLYTIGAFGNKEAVVAVSVETGKKEWSSEIATLFPNNWGDGPRSTPTLDGDFLYALSGDGTLACLKADSGAIVWSKSLTSKDIGGNRPGWGYCESPLVDGDKVVCCPGGNKGTMIAVNKKDGKLLWQCAELKDPAGYSSVVAADVAGGRQYVQTTMKGIVGVSPNTGKLLWRHERKGYSTAVIPTPIVHDGFVYATAGYGAGCDLLKITAAGQDPTKGTPEMEVVYTNKNMINQHGGVVLIDGHIYGFSDAGSWVCQEFKTGKAVWKDRGVGKGSVTAAEGMLYCYSEQNGTAALVEATATGYKQVSQFKIPKQTQVKRKSGKIWTHPVVANGKLYLRNQDLLFCFDIKDAK